MKLPGFPIAKTGETLTSVVARHLERSVPPKTHHLKLLGLKASWANFVIPIHISRFTSKMPLGHPWEGAPEVIAKGHTLIPLYLHFAHPERATTTVNAILTGGSEKPTLSLGLHAVMTKNAQRAARFCPDCVARDINECGFPILYRQHQPLFVRMCAVHARPLHFNCLHCQKNHKYIANWQMAGRCECNEPHMPPLLESNLDDKEEESWQWLSQQVETILAAPDSIATMPVAANLLAALKRHGFVGKNDSLNSRAMTEGLIDQFSEPFLKQVGFGKWCDPIEARPSKALGVDVINGGRIPYILGPLLLTRLVTDDVASLWNPGTSDPAPKREHLPIGSGRSSGRSSGAYFDKETVQSALNAAEWKICIAAKHLGVKAPYLAVDVRYHGIRLPLLETTVKRIGAERISAISEALSQGVVKEEIRQRYKLTNWSMLLIELDRPELSEAHREMTIVLKREKYRNIVLSFLRDDPSASRPTFITQYSGVWGWLRVFDRDWVDIHLPKPAYKRPQQGRKARKNWHQLDQAAVSVTQLTVQQELAKADRPIRLTRFRLLSAAGALAAMSRDAKHCYPTTASEVERLAETKEQFMHRLLRWTLQVYVGLNKAISTIHLRRVCHLDPYQLFEYRDYIIEVAEELRLPFDPRCSLAPWRNSARAGAALTMQ